MSHDEQNELVCIIMEFKNIIIKTPYNLGESIPRRNYHL